MVADRPYRAGRSPEEAVEELVVCRGGHFDPEVVDAFLDVVVPDVARPAHAPAA
jgi:HD-GYP domain-containing protein (c-di-GMP phosphodiesterase class II)